jgi:chloramphenicol 3-O phosphotransferase
MNLGVDVALQMTPPRCRPGVGLRPGEVVHAAAPFVPVLYAALYDSVAAHSRLGLNVAVDVGHHDEAILAECARRLANLPVLFVGVRCPIDVIMQRRNAGQIGREGRYVTGTREEPIPEPVSRWQREVHVPGIYDLEIDTSALTPTECATAIQMRLGNVSTPTAFQTLAERASSSE